MLLTKLRSRGLTGRRRRTDKGFTLVELLVVITILGILAAVVIAAVSGISDKGEDGARKTEEAIIRTAEEVSCTNQSKQAYDDIPQLRRDGFLASAAGYNDIDLDPINRAPQAACTDHRTKSQSRFALWSPTKTTYPVTVTGCNGYPQTFSKRPTKVLANTGQAYHSLINMGLADVAYLPSNLVQYLDSYLTVAERRIADKALVRNTLPATTAFTPSADQAYLAAHKPDLIYDTYAGFVKPGDAQPAGTLDNGYPREKTLQAMGYATYVGYAGNDFSGAFRCARTPLDAFGKPLAVDTLEGMFDEIRDLGVIFDAQDSAMKLITSIKTRMGDALLRGKAAVGARQVTVGAAVQYSTTEMCTDYSTTPAGTKPCAVNALFGNSPLNAAITSAGGTNPFRDQFSVLVNNVEQNNLTIARLKAANPEVMVLLTYDPATGPANCSSMVSSMAADFPAVAAGRYVCLRFSDFTANTPDAIDGILLLADKIASIGS